MATKNTVIEDAPFSVENSELPGVNDTDDGQMSFPAEDPDDKTLREAMSDMDSEDDDPFDFEVKESDMQVEAPDTGTYNCIAFHYEVKIGPKGKYLTIGWKILDSKWRNKAVWSNHSSSVGAQPITAQQFANIGLPYKEVPDPVTGEYIRKFQVNRQNVINKLARIKGKQGTYNGQPNFSVKAVLPPNQETRDLAAADPDLVFE